MLPKLSQEMLAEMIGTTRSRINLFMNKFRRLGRPNPPSSERIAACRSSGFVLDVLDASHNIYDFQENTMGAAKL
jgi:hypothetical protein